jgi:hypothetical protein
MIMGSPETTLVPEPGKVPMVVCSAGCKSEIPADETSLRGWENLPITGRWRCPQCWRELQAVNAPRGDNPV